MSLGDWLSDFAARGLLALSILLGADASAQQGGASNQPAAQQQQDNEAAAVKAIGALTDAAQKLVQEIAGDDAAKRAKEEEAERNKSDVAAQWDMAYWAEWMFKATAAQFVVGLVTLGLLWGTFREARRTADAAVDAAEAAQAAVKVSEDTAKSELRAYLSLSPAGIFYESGQRQLQIRVTQKNNGQTPALKVRFFGCVEFQDHPLPDNFDFPILEHDPGTNVIHPGHGFSLRPNRILSDQDLMRITGEQDPQRIYFFGALSYEDVFGQPHVTRVCWYYSNKTLFWEIGMIEMHQNNGVPQGSEVHHPDFFYIDRFNDAT